MIPAITPLHAQTPPAPDGTPPLPPFAIVTGDVVSTGGMDQTNLALANYLARQGYPLHVVAHRADPALLARPNVTFHRVARPLGSHFLSGPLLDRAGRRVGRQIAPAGGHVLVNGGNCAFGDINWVHYVHAAYTPRGTGSLARRCKIAIAHRVFLRDERKCLAMARVVIANSNRTRHDLIERVGVAPERIHTVYFGNDAETFFPASEEERNEIRQRLHWPADRPIAMFIGAPGDHRKGFDILFAAWQQLCQSSSWDTDLAVVGHGGQSPLWEQRAADAKIGSRIRFLGFRKDVPDLLRAADILVAPTRYEAYGLGVQEALCCGLPALVSADAGVAERYPRDLESLLLPDCEDSTDLAARLSKWRENAGPLRTSVETSCAPMRSRSWDRMAKEIVGAGLYIVEPSPWVGTT
jgi:glycosyltransferase involved in cell wall biosynthesis